MENDETIVDAEELNEKPNCDAQAFQTYDTEEDDDGMDEALAFLDAAVKRRRRGKIVTNFDDCAIAKLISAVECRECLWNTDNIDYKNRLKRDKAWQDIAENIFQDRYETSQLIAKWTNLRIQFKSYEAKVKKTATSGETTSTPVSWKYYKQMRFVANSAERNTPESIASNLVSPLKKSFNRQTTPKKVPRQVKHDGTRPVAMTGMTTASAGNVSTVDSFQIFGNFVAEELRKIPNQKDANRIQRKLTRNLMDYIEEIDSNIEY